MVRRIMHYSPLTRITTLSPSLNQKIFKLTQIPIKHRTFQSPPDPYGVYLEICARDRILDKGRKFHAHLLINGLNRSKYVCSKLITFYTQCGQICNARWVFDEMPKTDLGRWIALIRAYSRCGFYREVLDLFHEMQREGIKPDKYILPSILRACANVCDLKTGEKIHDIVTNSSFNSDAFIDTALIDMYSKCGWIEKARKMFDKMPQRDLVAWNAMVSGYAQQGFPKDALELVEKMQLKGLNPDLVTWNTLIAGFSQVGDDVMALNLFRTVRARGIEPDVVSWTSIIAGFVQNFRNSEAFDMFRQMVVAGLRPSSVTISSILPACATVADLRHGEGIHGYALVTGVAEDIFVSSSLIDMYAKCGLISDAMKLFNKMREKNTVSWNSMIFGYANHGYCEEAIELFHWMVEEEDEKPDHLTFTAVFMACSHAGMVVIGLKLFDLMQEEHGINPRLEHYACMVDLLGRAGKLSKAYDLIKAMPIEPDSFVWGALLGACRNHGNVKLAEIAASHLFRLEPKSAGNCVLMSNVFANAGRWGDAAKLKKMMKRRRLRRDQGCSWIDAV